MSTHNYPHTDFLNDTFSEDSLKLEVAADESITSTLDTITSSEAVDENGDPTGNITVTFDFQTDLSAGEITALDALVAAHTGADPVQVVFHASSVLADHEVSATDTDPGWTELGGAVTTPSFFAGVLAACKGRVVGQVKSNGTGAKLRICEDGVESGSFDVPDTEGAWQQMQWFSTDAPSEGLHTYTIEGQLPTSGATELKVKYVAVSLLEFC